MSDCNYPIHYLTYCSRFCLDIGIFKINLMLRVPVFGKMLSIHNSCIHGHIEHK